MHLSTPEGISINDFIDADAFTLHYATVDDVVAMESGYGKGCIMVKVDFKAAFRMVPIIAARSGTFCASIGRESTM